MQWDRVALLAGTRSLVADVSESPASRGWVIVGRCHTGVARPILGDVLGALQRADLATLVVPMGGSDLPTMLSWVAAATSEIRDQRGDERPIAFLGAGRGAAAGWLAAAEGDVDGILAWNARPGQVWRRLRWATVPSLLVVDGERRWRLLAAHAAGRRLGGPADVVAPRSLGDLALLGDWFERRLLLPAPLPIARAAQGPGRVRVASVATAMALAAGPAVSTAAAGAVPDFSAGSRLPAAMITRDSGLLAQVNTTTTTTTTSTVDKRLTAGEIKGDGPRGDPPLTDAGGLRWNINSNVGFTTTSSASGAVSEAAFTHAVAASTLNGGTVNATLVDAFDGYNALCLDLNNVGGQCNTANMAVYNQNGPGSLECSGRQAVLPASTIGAFEVRRKVFVPTNDTFARWLNIVRNTSGVAQTVRLVTSNNLGSDAGTRIVTTSDADTTPELSDTWVTTFQNFSGTTSSDPRLGHVLRGVGGPVGLAAIGFTDGDDNPLWRYQFSLAPGQTAIIMNFATGQPTKAAAAAQAAALANLTNPNALTCMTAAEIGQVLNFKTDSTTPTCVWGPVAGPPKRIDFTVQDVSSGIASIQITTSVNLVLPVAIPPFTVGTTSPISFSAVKDNQTLSSRVAVVITDVQGNQRSCV